MLLDSTFDRRLAFAARSLGDRTFHHHLLELVGETIPHESGWVVRYDPVSPPQILHTKKVPREVMLAYLDADCAAEDPYLYSWRNNADPRIETLADTLSMRPSQSVHYTQFKKRAAVSDEMAFYLPSAGRACLSLFLERHTGSFHASDLRRAASLFPAVLALHEAHIKLVLAHIVAKAGFDAASEMPILVADRNRVPVYASSAWRHLKNLAPDLSPDASDFSRIGDMTLRVIPLDDWNPIAPSGFLLFFPDQACVDAKIGEVRAAEIFNRCTPRERNILLLTLDGYSTGAIAQTLGLTKGYIKNCRLRVYRKLSVNSERQLIAVLAPFRKQLRAVASD